MVVRASHRARSLRRNEEVGPDAMRGHLDLGRVVSAPGMAAEAGRCVGLRTGRCRQPAAGSCIHSP